jgi:hypothetical protein
MLHYRLAQCNATLATLSTGRHTFPQHPTPRRIRHLQLMRSSSCRHRWTSKTSGAWVRHFNQKNADALNLSFFRTPPVVLNCSKHVGLCIVLMAFCDLLIGKTPLDPCIQFSFETPLHVLCPFGFIGTELMTHTFVNRKNAFGPVYPIFFWDTTTCTLPFRVHRNRADDSHIC